MRRFAYSLVITAMIAPVTYAQESTYDFEYMDFSGDLEFNLDSGLPERITNGAEIILYSEDGGGDRLRVRAATIVFESQEGAERPSKVILDGSVVVEHPQGTARAAHGEWSVDADVIIFTGSPVFEIANGMELKGDRAEMNLRTGKGRMLNSSATKVRFNSMRSEKASAPGLLAVEDITDWPALLGALKKQASSEDATPGRQIVQFIDPNMRKLLPGIDSTKAPTPENQAVIVKELNKALGVPGLYNETAWAGTSTDPIVPLMLEKGTSSLSSEELVLLNRRLFEAAYPGAIARFEPAAP